MAERHYFDAQPSVASRPAEVTLSLPEGVVSLRTDRGVFSGGRVDPGTSILLRAIPRPPSGGDLLDLGCGYGPIAVTLARRSPGATVWAVDVNERALDLVRENAAALGLANVRAAKPSEVPSDVRFDAIWSNPPIRIGKHALHELLLSWLGRLRVGGHAWLVVQKHLGGDSLAAWLTEQGYPTSRLGSKQAYRVLEVSGPGPAASGSRPGPAASGSRPGPAASGSRPGPAASGSGSAESAP
jgi:16S rRNA (guanine1207-N2)-methyltransferase